MCAASRSSPSQAYNAPIFCGPIESELVGSCLVRALAVRQFTPGAGSHLISSESDSAALAPLQQDFYLATALLVLHLSTIARPYVPQVERGLQVELPGRDATGS